MLGTHLACRSMRTHNTPAGRWTGLGLPAAYPFWCGGDCHPPVAVALEIAILVDAAAPDIVAVENDFADHRQLHLPS